MFFGNYSLSSSTCLHFPEGYRILQSAKSPWIIYTWAMFHKTTWVIPTACQGVHWQEAGVRPLVCILSLCMPMWHMCLLTRPSTPGLSIHPVWCLPRWINTIPSLLLLIANFLCTCALCKLLGCHVNIFLYTAKFEISYP